LNEPAPNVLEREGQQLLRQGANQAPAKPTGSPQAEQLSCSISRPVDIGIGSNNNPAAT